VLVISERVQSNGSILEIAVERQGDTGSLVLTGECGHAHSGKLDQQLRSLAQDEAVSILVLDMQGLRSIDTAGLEVIRSAWAATSESGVPTILVRASSQVRFALEESGLDRLLPVIYECPDAPTSW
jgi:anti-anti-sigma factor